MGGKCCKSHGKSGNFVSPKMEVMIFETLPSYYFSSVSLHKRLTVKILRNNLLNKFSYHLDLLGKLSPTHTHPSRDF